VPVKCPRLWAVMPDTEPSDPDPTAEGAPASAGASVESLGVVGEVRPWQVELAVGTAQQLHDAAVDPSRRSVRVQELLHPAIVLGSTQRRELADAAVLAARGVELASRRSGGGAVLLEPQGQVWLDVVLPADDPLWVDDVVRSSWWLGGVWAATLRALDGGAGPAPEVHQGGVDAPELGSLVCFAALGPGEVSVAGRKVVGISQRRTRHGARFQCVVALRWEPSLLTEALHLGAHRTAVANALADRAGPWRPSVAPGVGTAGSPGGTAGSVRVPAGLREDPGWSVVEEFLLQLP